MITAIPMKLGEVFIDINKVYYDTLNDEIYHAYSYDVDNKQYHCRVDPETFLVERGFFSAGHAEKHFILIGEV